MNASAWVLTLFLAIPAMTIQTGSAAYGAELRIYGDNGWKARVVLGQAGVVAAPVFLIMVGPDGRTNTEAFTAEKGEGTVSLGLTDGSYRYRVVDSDKKELLSGRFDLKTPFRLKWARVAFGEAVLEVVPAGRIPVQMTLSESGQPLQYRELTVARATNLTLSGLRPSVSYLLRVASGDYQRTLEFMTPPENTALGRPVFGTFRRLPESRFVDDSTPAITRVNDGIWGWYRGMAVSGELKREDQFVYINLEKDRALRSFTVVWHGLSYPRQYYLVVGTDGKLWKQIRRDSGKFMKRVAPDNSPVMVDTLETNVTAKYVGVIVPKGKGILGKSSYRNTLSLMEIEAYE